MRYVHPEKWLPCDGIQLEENADIAVRCGDNHVLVIAGPGAGKTELLAQKAAFLFQTNLCREPQRILAISFKRDSAQNLKNRVEQRCGADVKGRFVSMTYDAFAKSIVDHFLYALPEELRPLQHYLVDDLSVMDIAFEAVGYRNPDKLSDSKRKAQYESFIRRVSLPIVGSEIGHRVWPLLLHGYNGGKATLTYEMILMLALFIVKTNPKIKHALHMTYSYVFLDEFQDTTDRQYTFVQECFGGSNSKVTAVGDNKQRIMGWAGAKKGIFNEFYKEWKPKGVRLVMNHRSAPRLVKLQRAMYDSLNEKATEVHVSEKWGEEEGDITLLVTDNEKLEAVAVSKDINKRITEGTKPKDICILCKQTPQCYVSEIIEALGSYGIRARLEAEYQDIIKEPIIELILKFMLCASESKHPKEWTDVLDASVDFWGIHNGQRTDNYYEIQRKAAVIADGIKCAVREGISSEQWHGILEQILSFFNVERIKATFPNYSQGNYLEELLTKFEHLFFDEYITAYGDWIRAIENFSGEHSIPIMTIHKSKGLEYSAVYFIGLEDSAFWNFKKQPDEDRCAFFVALSRAKEAVTFTFCKKRMALKYPTQEHKTINEFYCLLQRPGVAEVVFATE